MKNTELTDYERKRKNRLNKIHRLKRENLVLSAKRKAIEYEVFEKSQQSGWFVAIALLVKDISKLSESIGKNSIKIQRLRTLIAQDKSKYES